MKRTADDTTVEQTLEMVVYELAGLRDMRARLNAVLQALDVDAETLADVQLATSELVTNGFIHGAATEVGVRAQIRPDRIEMRIQHRDAAGPARPRRRPTPQDPGGRGLAIVGSIGDEVQVERVAGIRATDVTFDRLAPLG